MSKYPSPVHLAHFIKNGGFNLKVVCGLQSKYRKLKLVCSLYLVLVSLHVGLVHLHRVELCTANVTLQTAICRQEKSH